VRPEESKPKPLCALRACCRVFLFALAVHAPALKHHGSQGERSYEIKSLNKELKRNEFFLFVCAEKVCRFEEQTGAAVGAARGDFLSQLHQAQSQLFIDRY
jgi:hypothetical protein